MKDLVIKAIVMLGVALSGAFSFANENEIAEPLVPAEGYEAFFNGYMHKHGPCMPGFIRYYTSAYTFIDSRTAKDSGKFSTLKIYLLAGGQYIANADLLIPWTDFGEGIKRIVDSQQIRQEWHVENGLLVLENLGTGRAVQIVQDGKILRGIELKIENQSLTEYAGTVYYLTNSESTNVVPELEVACP